MTEEVGDAFFSIGSEFAMLNLIFAELRVYCETKSRVNNEKESPHRRYTTLLTVLDNEVIIKSKQLSHPIQNHLASSSYRALRHSSIRHFSRSKRRK
jgi:hypothetical protein